MAPASRRPARSRAGKTAKQQDAEALQEIFAGSAEIAAMNSAYDAELATSVLLGGLYRLAPVPDRAGQLATFSELFVKHVAAQRTREAGGVLAGFAGVAPGKAAARARKAVRRFPSDQPLPAWATVTGEVTLTSTWSLTDVYGDQTQYIAAYEYADPAGGLDHAVYVQVDHNRGVVEELNLVTPGRTLVEGVKNTQAPGVTIRQVEPGVLRADVLDAIARTDALPRPPGGDAYVDQWALAVARIESLPEGFSGGRPPPLADQVRDELVDEFLTAYGEDLVEPGGVVPVSAAKVAARLAVDYAVDVNSGNPLRWSPTAVAGFLTEWAPRQQRVTGAVGTWLPEVLGAFVVYAGGQMHQPPHAIRRTAETIGACWTRFTERLTNRDQPESMEVVRERMVADGVNPDDDEAARRWLTAYVEAQEEAQRPDGGEPGKTGA